MPGQVSYWIKTLTVLGIGSLWLVLLACGGGSSGTEDDSNETSTLPTTTLPPGTGFEVINNQIQIGGQNVTFDATGKASQVIQFSENTPKLTLALAPQGPSGTFSGEIVMRLVRPDNQGSFQTVTLSLDQIQISGPVTKIQLPSDQKLRIKLERAEGNVTLATADLSAFEVNQNQVTVNTLRLQEIAESFVTGRVLLTPGSYDYSLEFSPSFQLQLSQFTGTFAVVNASELTTTTSTTSTTLANASTTTTSSTSGNSTNVTTTTSLSGASSTTTSSQITSTTSTTSVSTTTPTTTTLSCATSAYELSSLAIDGQAMTFNTSGLSTSQPTVSSAPNIVMNFSGQGPAVNCVASMGLQLVRVQGTGALTNLSMSLSSLIFSGPSASLSVGSGALQVSASLQVDLGDITASDNNFGTSSITASGNQVTINTAQLQQAALSISGAASLLKGKPLLTTGTYQFTLTINGIPLKPSNTFSGSFKI